MKFPSALVVATALVLAIPSSHASAADPEWQMDPRPFTARTTRLYEISVHRFVLEPSTGARLERRELLTASGLRAFEGDFPVPVTATVPEEAYDKLLVSASHWLGYQRLGPRALENFRLVSEFPIDVSGRWHFEVAVADGAKGNVGPVLNLSARADVTPTSPLQGGFVIEAIPRTVLIRAVGPGLLQFGVGNALADSRLQLYHNGQVILTNDDWSVNTSNQVMVERATSRTGAFPLAPGSKDAASAITLPPGAYTAHASGVGNGAVLLEVYILD